MYSNVFLQTFLSDCYVNSLPTATAPKNRFTSAQTNIILPSSNSYKRLHSTGDIVFQPLESRTISDSRPLQGGEAKSIDEMSYTFGSLPSPVPEEPEEVDGDGNGEVVDIGK